MVSALFTILYLVRQNDLNFDSITASVEEPPFKLFQKPSEVEVTRLENTLHLLEKIDVPLQSMLHFVIMTKKFDMNSKYVKDVVDNALEDIGNYGNLEKLLIYLSIMKYFGGKGMPSSHCHRMIDELSALSIENKQSLMDYILTTPAKFFVCEVVSEKSIKTLEITHEPVAYHLLQKFTNFSVSVNPLYERIMDLLGDNIIINHNFARPEVHKCIRETLGNFLLLRF